MPKYNVVLCLTDEDEMTALTRLAERGLRPILVELPIEKNDLPGDRVIFRHNGKSYVKFSQVQSTSGAWRDNYFPEHMLFACRAGDLPYEVALARLIDAGLVVVRGDKVQRLV